MEILMRISNHSSFEEDCSKCINSNEEWKIEKKIVTSLFVILFLLKVKLINLLYLLITYYLLLLLITLLCFTNIFKKFYF